MTIAVSPSHPSNPTSPFYSRAIISRSTTTTAAAVTSSSPSAKVSDRIVKLITYDPEADCEGVNICWWSGLDLGFLSPSYDGGGLFCDSRSLAKGWQVVLTQEMQGMVVAVPEPKAWDTP
ncbi:hypothetical protein Tco_0435058 [Tanacetum coccineum]